MSSDAISAGGVGVGGSEGVAVASLPPPPPQAALIASTPPIDTNKAIRSIFEDMAGYPPTTALRLKYRRARP
jgi:hypothetical protein